MAPKVPAELTDIIIDALEHDLETLEICSQVARSWRPRSLIHLFSAIEVRADEIPGDAAWTQTRQHLHSAIQMTGSRFSHFVSRRSGRAMFPLIRRVVFMAYAAHWATFAGIWNNLDIPSKLVRVQYLRISIQGSDTPGSFIMPWARDSFETTIVRLVRLCSSHLESLSISAYRSGFNTLYIPHVIMRTVECCPLVHYLHIDSVGQAFRYQPSDPVPDWSNLARRGPVRISTDYINAPCLLQWSARNVDSVQGITFVDGTDTASEPEWTRPSKLVLPESTMVTRLAVIMSLNEDHNMYDIANFLERVPALSVLELRAVLGDDDTSGSTSEDDDDSEAACDPVWALARVLQEASQSLPSLRTIILQDEQLHWDLPTADSEDDHSSTSSDPYDWGNLDITLSTTKWKGVQKFIFCVVCRWTREGREVQRALQSRVDKLLPEFTARGGKTVIICTNNYAHLRRSELIEECLAHR